MAVLLSCQLFNFGHLNMEQNIKLSFYIKYKIKTNYVILEIKRKIAMK